YTINADGKLSRPRTRHFRTNPKAATLNAAAKLSAASAYKSHGAVVVDTECPELQGHCQVRIELFLRGRVIIRRGYQQTPDTFHRIRLLPSKASERRALRY